MDFFDVNKPYLGIRHHLTELIEAAGSVKTARELSQYHMHYINTLVDYSDPESPISKQAIASFDNQGDLSRAYQRAFKVKVEPKASELLAVAIGTLKDHVRKFHDAIPEDIQL